MLGMIKHLLVYFFLVCYIPLLHAQYVDSIWQVQNNTHNYLTFSFADNSYFEDISPLISQSSHAAYTYSVTQDLVTVSYTKPATSQWASLEFYTLMWNGDTTNVFTKNIAGKSINHSVAEGVSVSMKQKLQRTAHFEIQAAESFSLLGALVDIQGKISSETFISISATPEGIDISDESKWTSITMSWSADIPSSGGHGTLIDERATSWWGRSNMGLRNVSHMIDSSHIVGIIFYADPGPFGVVGHEKEFVIRNLQIGASTSFDSQDISLSWDSPTSSISLREFAQTDLAEYSISHISSPLVDVSLSGDNLSITAHDVCTSFTARVSVAIFENNVFHEQAFVVTFTKHELQVPHIGAITIDVNTGLPILLWSPFTEPFYESYSIYSYIGDETTHVQTIGIDDAGEFLISHSQIFQNPQYYSITSTDYCNVESDYSSKYTPINLSFVVSNNELELMWNPYEGAAVSEYFIVAGTNTKNLERIHSSSWDNTSVILPKTQYSLYCVEGVLEQAFLATTSVFSNCIEVPTSVSACQAEIMIYPNPVQTYVNIINTTDIPNLSVYDMFGTVVLAEIFSNSIDVSVLPSGMYFLHIRIAEYTLIKKIIVQ